MGHKDPIGHRSTRITDAYEEMVLNRLANQSALTTPIVEWIDDNGRLLRTMMPTYSSEDCLACHGNPKGILGISGYPREGDRVGELARAISIQIPRTIGSRQPVLDGGKQRGDLPTDDL